MDSQKLRYIHKHPLTLVAGQSECKACNFYTKSDHYYHCFTCESAYVSFHKECVTYYSEITHHPYHPIHPLKFCKREPEDTVSNCFWCNRYMGYFFYRCSICNLNIHLFCANQTQTQLVLTLDPGNKHEHLLTFFPRRMSFICNLCGFYGDWYPIYACIQCDFMIHSHCLSLPNVIRISCHEHRISRRLYLTQETRPCGVCHMAVDPKYGAFSCAKDCGYVVHVGCATLSNLWDGSELENVPEDVDELKDVEPYEVIGDNLIKHFSHDHNLRLVLNQDGAKRNHCKACSLLIQFDNFYTCDDHCDFILHQECAEFKRKRWQPLHPHPLTLKADDDNTLSYSSNNGRRGFYFCSACSRFSCGFRYICGKGLCGFELDMLCAATPEQINHKSHIHPLFLRLINTHRVTCGNYQKESNFMLYCLESHFNLCFKCATLPDKVIYKHDQHPLILCCGEEEEEEKGGQYWCETCETKLDPKQWFYKCEDCSVTLHIPCLLGSSPYANPGPIMIKAQKIDEETEEIHHYPLPDDDVLVEPYFDIIPIRFEDEFDIVANETLSRPLCCHCNRRCQYPVAFKQEQDFYCSLECLCKRKKYSDSVLFPEI